MADFDDPDDKPVQLGDYLDEIDRAPIAKPAPPRQPAPTPPPRPAPGRSRTKTAVSAKRTRLNVSDAARDQLAAVVDKMDKSGPEPDVRASEVLEALIMAMYEAREYLNLSNVQARGRWGTPTAKAFPVALKQSVSRAMGEAVQANAVNG